MSTFISHFVSDLSQRTLPLDTPSTSNAAGVQIASTRSKETLQGIFLDLDQAQSLNSLRQFIGSLQYLEQDQQLLSAELGDAEEQTLRQAVLGKVTLGLYAHALETLLEEASEAETELEWWSDLGRSRRKVAYYLLQSASPPPSW